MIDKLDFLFPYSPTSFSKDMSNAIQYAHWRRSPVRGFCGMYDLSGFGIPMAVHLPFSPQDGDQLRAELRESGRSALPQTLSELNQHLGYNTAELKVTRVDLAADVEAIPLDWFRQNMTVKFKRRFRDHSCWDNKEGLTFGRRPNLYRVYDKSAQLRSQGRMAGKAGVITRVERQFAGRGLPYSFRVLASLLEGARKYQPFDNLRFRATPNASYADLSPSLWLNVEGLEAALSRMNLQEVRQRLGPNGPRTLERLLPYVKAGKQAPPHLHEIYLRSLNAQLRSTASTGEVQSLYKQSTQLKLMTMSDSVSAA